MYSCTAQCTVAELHKLISTLPNAFENINYESCLPSNLSPAILWQNNFPNFFLSNPALPETDFFPNESRLLPDPFLYFLRAKSAEDFSRNTTLPPPFCFENVWKKGKVFIFPQQKSFLTALFDPPAQKKKGKQSRKSFPTKIFLALKHRFSLKKKRLKQQFLRPPASILFSFSFL